MGCCCSIFSKDNTPQGIEATVRTPLLADPVNNTNIPRIYSNRIDVEALDSQNLEQHVERPRVYAKRIQTSGVKVPRKIPCWLADIPAPEAVLSAESLSPGAQEQLSNMFDHAVTALTDIKAEHKEDLVYVITKNRNRKHCC